MATTSFSHPFSVGEGGLSLSASAGGNAGNTRQGVGRKGGTTDHGSAGGGRKFKEKLGGPSKSQLQIT
jgi:hypothetical protein